MDKEFLGYRYKIKEILAAKPPHEVKQINNDVETWAEISSSTRKTIYNLEKSDTNDVKFITLYTIAKILNCEVMDLVNGDPLGASRSEALG